MNVRPMRESDIETVARIERNSFAHPWSRVAFLSELRKPYAHNYILDINDPTSAEKIGGYACFHTIAGEMHLLKIAVSPEMRRKGIAEILLRRCLRDASGMRASAAFLEVRPSNRAAVNLYKKFGFDVIAVRPDYYTMDSGQNEDAMIMRINLKRR